MSFSWRKISKADIPLGLLYSAICLGLVIGVRLVESGVLSHSLFCPFKSITGIPCLTCGTTRALGAMSHFDMVDAFLFNPLVTAGIFIIWAWGLVSLYGLAARHAMPMIKADGAAAMTLRITVIAIAFANWAYLAGAGI